MKSFILLAVCVNCIISLNAQKAKAPAKNGFYATWKTNLDSMYVTTNSGNKKVQFIDEDKTGIRTVQAIIYSNGFISAIIDYKDTKGQLLGSRYAMKAKRAGGERFIANKVFTDKKKYLPAFYKAPFIPPLLAGKLKMLGELDGIKGVIDGIKNLKSVSDFLNAKLPSGLDAFGGNAGKGGKNGYSSGVPWGLFDNKGKAKDSSSTGLISGGRHEGASENSDGSVTFYDSYTSSDGSMNYGSSVTISPNGHTESTITQVDGGGPNGRLRIVVTHESSTQNSDGSPDDYESREGTTDVATGKSSETTLTVRNGSSVGVQTHTERDGNGNVTSQNSEKVNVTYNEQGTPRVADPSSTPSEASGHLSPAEEEQFWQSLPWLADMLFNMWAKEYTASLKRGNITRPGIGDEGKGTVRNNPYRFNRVVIINCSEVHSCIPVGRTPTNPRQTWRNLVNPPPIPH